VSRDPVQSIDRPVEIGDQRERDDLELAPATSVPAAAQRPSLVNRAAGFAAKSASVSALTNVDIGRPYADEWAGATDPPR
jgi:hypothetical protein